MKEWYLIGNKTKPNMLGGYENQGFLDYKEDAFAESLETDIATTVLLCNSDLSIKKRNPLYYAGKCCRYPITVYAAKRIVSSWNGKRWNVYFL